MSVSVQQKTQLVFLSSKSATQYYNSTHLSDLTFRLPRPIQRPKDHNLQVKVSQFIFPVSFYNVNSTNNTLKYAIDGVVQTDIELEEGNYTASTLADELREKLGGDFSVLYNEETMYFYISHSSLEFYFDETSTCFKLLGFTEGEDHFSDDELFTLSSDFPVDLSPTKALYVSIPNLSINNINGNTGQRTPIIACVPITEEAGDIEVFSNDLGLSAHTQEDVINEFNIRIYDEDQSTLIDFKNAHWLMTIQLRVERTT